jgi:hypothetical protein
MVHVLEAQSLNVSRHMATVNIKVSRCVPLEHSRLVACSPRGHVFAWHVLSHDAYAAQAFLLKGSPFSGSPLGQALEYCVLYRDVYAAQGLLLKGCPHLATVAVPVILEPLCLNVCRHMATVNVKLSHHVPLQHRELVTGSPRGHVFDRHVLSHHVYAAQAFLLKWSRFVGSPPGQVLGYCVLYRDVYAAEGLLMKGCPHLAAEAMAVVLEPLPLNVCRHMATVNVKQSHHVPLQQ